MGISLIRMTVILGFGLLVAGSGAGQTQEPPKAADVATGLDHQTPQPGKDQLLQPIDIAVPNVEGGLELRAYGAKSIAADKVAECLQAFYPGAIPSTVAAIGKNWIGVWTTPKIHADLLEKFESVIMPLSAGEAAKATAEFREKIAQASSKEPQQPSKDKKDAAKAKVDEPPELKIYLVESKEAKKIAEAMQAAYKASPSLRITAVGDTQIMIYAPPKIQLEIAVKFKDVFAAPANKGGAKILADAVEKAWQLKDKKKGPLTLDEAMAKATKQNPDFLVAAAKLCESVAALNRVNALLEVHIAMSKADYDGTQAILTEVIAKLQRLRQLRAKHGGSVVTDEELGTAEAVVAKYKAEAAQKEQIAKTETHKADIVVAEAKVRLAEAELNQVRQHVMAKVAMAFADIEEGRAIVKEAQAKFARLKQLQSRSTSAVVTDEELGEAEAILAKWQAELAKREAALEYLVGNGSDQTHPLPFEARLKRYNEIMEEAGYRKIPWEKDLKIPNADKLRKALETPIKLMHIKNDTLQEVVQHLQDRAKQNGGEINLMVSLHGKIGAVKLPEIYLLEPVTLAAAMQLLEDTMKGLRFVIRDYGVLCMVDGDVPPGALFVSDFMKLSQNKELKKEAK